MSAIIASRGYVYGLEIKINMLCACAMNVTHTGATLLYRELGRIRIFPGAFRTKRIAILSPITIHGHIRLVLKLIRNGCYVFLTHSSILETFISE